MTFNQWLALMTAVFVFVTAHKAIVLSIDHILTDIRNKNFAAAKTDLIDLAKLAFETVVTQSKETPHAQEDSEQSQSSSQAPQSPSGSG